jgi:hypothetical protein
MVHYATYFDRHYLTRGLALYRSLVRHSPPFRLWVLCLDEETHRVLSRLRSTRLTLVPLAELERSDGQLPRVKPGRRPLEYYWTCTAPFLLHVLVRCPEIDPLTYLDADTLFFGDPTPLYEELGDSAISLIEHRRPPVADPRLRERFAAVGTYNVSLQIFRRTADGLACLRWWRERCLEWCFNRLEPGRFGDQKYLEEWPARFRGVAVLRHPGAGVAQWNLATHRFRWDGRRVLVDDQPLISYHFVRFRPVTQWLYDTGLWRFRRKMPPTVRHHVYVPYARELRSAGRLIRAIGGRPDPVDDVELGRFTAAWLRRMLRERTFLIVTDRLALWAWGGSWLAHTPGHGAEVLAPR